jgi:hypothetical protein
MSTSQGCEAAATPVVMTNVSNPRFIFQRWVTHRLGSLRFAFPSRHGGSRYTPLRASLGGHACSSRAFSSLAASTCVPSMLRRRTGYPAERSHRTALDPPLR